MASCFPDDYDRCGEEYRFENNNCLKLEDDTPSNGGSEDAGDNRDTIDKEKWIGSTCRCEGDQCRLLGIPSLVYGTVVGCEDIPKDWPGAEVACRESYEGDYNRNTYFAQGFCTLLAVACDGDDLICSASDIGNFQAMTACPENSAMITVEYTETVEGLNAKLTFRSCAPTCDKDSDCRVDAFDEILDEPGQYQCIDKDGVKFCLDPRNLTDDYSAEAF